MHRVLASNSTSPLDFQTFVPRSSASSKPRPAAQIQELWFPSNTKKDDDELPDKPKKLTPVFSKTADDRSFIKDAKNNEKAKKDGGDPKLQPVKTSTPTDPSAKLVNSQKPKNGTVKQMPEMPFDFIWGTDDLPNILGGKHQSHHHSSSKNKTLMGGRKAKVADNRQLMTIESPSLDSFK